VLSAIAAALATLLPWGRLFRTVWGMRILYGWAGLNILLITVASWAAGGSGSSLLLLYARTIIPDRGVQVLADRQRLKQVLLNFLSNGVKYNLEGGTATVSCVGSQAEMLTISVADTGRGIPAEQLERLFSPFDRLGAERTDTEGTGLGLALSKALVEAMGGTVRVESEVDRGSTFFVDLPVA
ncbi:MAG TPA: ATP-binding protein, partial [Actinomycetota bacterium]